MNDRGFRVAACAEFPNDNGELHEGSIWRCAEPRAEASAEGRSSTSDSHVPSNDPQALPASDEEFVTSNDDERFRADENECLTSDDDGFEIEIVDHLDFEAVDEPLFTVGEPLFASDAGPSDPMITEPAALDIGAPLLDIGEPLALDTETVDTAVAHPTTEPPPDEGTEGATSETRLVARDPFATLATAVANAALQLGASREATDFVPALLGLERIDDRLPGEAAAASLIAAKILVDGGRGLARTPAFTSQLLGWQGILRGESEDFAACGEAMLDEWSAAIVACLVGDASRASTVRRELRRHGVAAFGLVAEAA